MSSQYLVLQVIIPIFFSLLNIAFSSDRVGQWLFFLATLLNLVLLTPIYNELLNSDNQSITYLLGDYSNKYGIELKLNFFSFLFLSIINYTAFLVSMYKINFKGFSYKKNSLLLLAITGFTGIIISNDIFNIYVFLEISSLASYALITSNNTSLPSLYAGFNYLIFGTIGATFYLVGISFLYLLSGTLNISILIKNTGVYNDYNQNFILLSFFFIICGLILKIGVFPVHNWLNNVYKKSENYLTIFLSGISSTISIYIFCLFIFNIFIWRNIIQITHINIILQITGSISIIYFSFLAYINNNVKKILIYSSFAQVGYFFCCLGIGTQESIIAFCLQLINHGLSKAALLSLFSYEMSHEFKSKLIKITHFLLSALFVFNLIGIPLLFGFFAKFKMFVSVIEVKNWAMLICLVVSTLFSILYGLKLTRYLKYQEDQQIKKFFEFEENVKKLQNNEITTKQLYLFTIICIAPLFLSLFFYQEISNFVQYSSYNLLILR